MMFYERGRPRICVLPSVHSTVTLTLIGRFHIYWAILEGIALTICRCGTAMGKETGESHGRLVVSGGGSDSDVFTHIFADVFGIPAARAKMNNAAGLGSAICAAVSQGLYGPWDDAIDNMVSWESPLAPDETNHDLYQQLSCIYEEIPSLTDNIFEQSYKLSD